MANRNEVLVALAAEIRASLGNETTSATRRRWAIEIEALAAPAEGDGAVYQWHEFAGRWEDFTKEQFDEVQSSGEIVLGETIITPAMTRKLYTRPAATAVVARPSDDELWDQTLRERDDAEKALGDMFQAVTGRSAEWSSAWHYKDAIEEVEDHMAMLATAPAAPAEGGQGEVAEIEMVTDRYGNHFTHADAKLRVYNGYAPKVGDKLYTAPPAASVDVEKDNTDA